MALSQLQCLDDNNVNARTHEAKSEFFYCENQRLALEVLLQDGREAFRAFLKERELRGFLSDPELETLTAAAEPYDPGSDVLLGHSDYSGDADAEPLSLHYWPDLSDTSVPDLDLGWPDCASYRGVTRTNVFTQPPLDGQVHIKEIVRKTIAQAQKVIAVVMDVFTDVDIFRDLLEAGHRRKVSVYIVLERTALPHFLSMCDRANMHPGHLKNLRVRCGGGGEFFTRSCTRFRGRLGHRFMFVDGDRAVSGSYCYTWMSSRLDRHLVTVVTGQAVDSFDRLFRELYGTSSAVDLQRVAMEPEPEPQPLPQPVAVAPTSADVARKMYNPKYALLAMGTNSTFPAFSSAPNTPKDSNSQDNAGMKGKRKMAKKAAQVEAPPLHPGLVDLEKAYLIPYLPTWPEPDPSSDVIGFINVRDSSRQMQVHMQRSERFETSQAIRFSSPFSAPQETLPEVAQPRQRANNLQGITVETAHPTQVSIQEVAVDKAQPISPYTRLSTPATQPLGQDVHIVQNKSVDAPIQTSGPIVKAETQPVNTEAKPSTNTATQQITQSHIDTPASFSHTAIFKPGSAGPTHPIHNLAIKDPERYSDIASQSHVGQSTLTIHTDKNIHSENVSISDHMQTSSPTFSHVHASLNAIHQNNAALPIQTEHRIAHKVSCQQDLDAKPQSPYKEDFTPPTQISTLSSTTSIPSSPIPTTTTVPVVPPACPSPSTTHALLSSIPTLSRLSSTSNPSINSHSTNTSPIPLPVPKPRTVHLLMNNWSKCNVQNQPLNSGVVSEPGSSSGSGPVVDVCKPVFKQEEDAIMTATGMQVGPNSVFNSTTKSAKWQDRSDMNLLNDAKEFPDGKKATGQRTQSILSVNPLQADDKPFRAKMPKGSGNTKQAGNMVRSHRVNEGLSKPDKDSESATTEHFKKATQHVQPNEGLLHETLDSVLCAHTQGGQRGVTASHPSNDEAVNHTYVLNSDKPIRDVCTPEKKMSPHTLELPACVQCSQTPEKESPPCAPVAGRISPCSPTAMWRTPDARCCSSPNTRTPTPDTSDGYISSRDDSALSTTSEEYYECNESPHPSPIFDQGIGLDISMMDDHFIATPLAHRDHTRATSASADSNIMPSPMHMNAADTKRVFETPANTSTSPLFLPKTRAQAKYKGEPEEGRGRDEYKLGGLEDGAARLSADEQSRTGSEGLSQTAKEARHSPLKITSTASICLIPQRRCDPPETVDVDRCTPAASGNKSVDIQAPTQPILRRSSSSASSENTVSPFITPIPSPAPTPTPKRAATHPRRPQPDTEVGRSAVVSSRGGQGEGKPAFRKDSLQEPGEFTTKWEEDLRRDEQKDTELDLGTSKRRSSGDLHSEISALKKAEMTRGPWVARETEGKKGLRSSLRAPAGRPLQQNHNSPVSLQYPAAKPTRPTRPSSGSELPRSYQPAAQVSSTVDHESPQTLHLNSAQPRQPPFRRHSSLTPGGSLKCADQKSSPEGFIRRSFHDGQSPAGQGSGHLPKPQPSFLYSYTNAQSQPQLQTQPAAYGNSLAQTQSKSRQGTSSVGDLEPGDLGQDLSKAGFSFSKLYNLKGHKKGSSSPSQSQRSRDPSKQVRKSTG